MPSFNPYLSLSKAKGNGDKEIGGSFGCGSFQFFADPGTLESIGSQQLAGSRWRCGRGFGAAKMFGTSRI